MNLLKNPEYYKTFAVRIRSRSWPFHSRRQFFQLVICANVKPPHDGKTTLPADSHPNRTAKT